MGVRCDREIKEEHDKDCVDEGFQLTRAKLEGGGGCLSIQVRCCSIKWRRIAINMISLMAREQYI